MGVLCRAVFFVLAILLVWHAPAAPQQARMERVLPIHQIEESVVSIDAPGDETVGLVWGGNRLWASDQEEDEISYWENGAWVTLVEWDGDPGPLAWGGDALWVVDVAANNIVRLDTSSRPLTRTVVPIPPAALRDPPAITGLAWIDGELWLATGCGLCSTIFRLDAKTGKELQSFFPKCVPRGFAYYKGGLWTVAYGGPRKDSMMSRRPIKDGFSRVRSSQQFFRIDPVSGELPPGYSAPPVDPTAIAIINGAFWVVDRDSEPNRISQYDPRPIPGSPVEDGDE